MSIRRRGVTLCVLAFLLTNSASAQSNELDSLRAAIDELRADYDARIAALEQRLAVAEQNAGTSLYASSPAQAVSAAPASRSSSADAAFNPAIGVIFQGQAWSYDNNPEDYYVQGFPFGGEAGPFAEGLSIGEAEINISASVDDKFTAWLTAPLVIEDG